MAIDIVDEVLDSMGQEERLYVYHEIVHNTHVVERLKNRGAIFVDHIHEVPEHSVVIFSAHGVSPAIRKEAEQRSLVCIDATCPLVTKVHYEAIRYAKRGWQIILIGHKNHQEVVGTQGEAPDSIQIVESPEDIQYLKINDPKKLVYLTQTTLSVDDAKQIISALVNKYPEIHSPPSDDICYATTNRQTAVREDSKDADLVIVVGSQNSSNSKRLAEIAQNSGKPAYLIDDVDQLDKKWFKKQQTVLITAGASAPEHLVNEIVTELKKTFSATVLSEAEVDEGMSFSMPVSLMNFIKSKNVTIDGKNNEQ